MIKGKTMNKSFGKRAACVVSAGVLAAAFAMQGGIAFAENASVSQMTPQATIEGMGQAEVMTDANGAACLKITVATAGAYTISSTVSAGVDYDTIATLYSSSYAELASNDDNAADTNFCISQNLSAGTYYLKVQGKESQQDASITVAVNQGTALNTLNCDYDVVDGKVCDFALGTWSHGSKTTWKAAATSAYTVTGYADREIFLHAQESGAVDQLAWSDGLPATTGRFVVKVSATEGAGYIGDAYYFADNVDSAALSELDPYVTYATCGAISKVELGTTRIVPTNWKAEWAAISSSYYTTVGYMARADFEAAGGDTAAAAWIAGNPAQVGKYVVKLSATSVKGNPYNGVAYVWTEVEETNHAGSGKWIVDVQATHETEGSRHLVCAYCGGECDVTAIPVLSGPSVGDTVTADKGVTAAQYKVNAEGAVTYLKCATSGKSATVPDSVTIEGEIYYVTAIGKNAFAKSKVTTVTVKATMLGKSTVKKCFAGSSVKTVKVPKAYKKAYTTYFAAGNCGKSVKVK